MTVAQKRKFDKDRIDMLEHSIIRINMIIPKLKGKKEIEQAKAEVADLENIRNGLLKQRALR